MVEEPPKSAGACGKREQVAGIYALVIVKVPVPEHPPPAMDHVPEIVLPFAVPFKVSVLPAGSTELTRKPKLPCMLPFRLPLSVKDPVAVSLETKQGESL